MLALDPTVLAAAAEPPPHPTQLTWWEQVRDFVPLDIHQLNHQFLGFREYFWSARLLEFIPIAGAIAVARRSIPKAGVLRRLARRVLRRQGLVAVGERGDRRRSGGC